MFNISHLRSRTLEVKKEWKRITAERSCIEAKLRVGIAGSFTVEPVVPYLGSELFDRACVYPEIAVAPYNQIFQTCLNPAAAFEGEVDLAALLIRIEDMFASEFESFVGGNDSGLSKAIEGASELSAAVRGLGERLGRPLLVSIPPYPACISADLKQLRSASRAALFHRRFVDHWCSILSEVQQIFFIDLEGIQRDLGVTHCRDTRKWYLYRQPYSEEFWFMVGENIARIYAALKGKTKKCVVVDCDNTLWGGVVGEEGLEGIQIGTEFPGSAYHDFQKQLIKLHGDGVFVAIVSKNNEPDVWEVFDRHDGMLLNRSHLAAWRVNWSPKDQNIREIASELNIGLDSFVFVDDSHFEIAAVKQMLPEVTCFQVPEDPSELPEAFASLHFFDRLTITSEDFIRTAMVTQERERNHAKEAMSQEDFLLSLGLVAEVFEVRDEHVGRVAQLINKTNQFNLSTIRRTQAEVEALRHRSDSLLFAVKVYDRFGDYGLVGSAIIHNHSNTFYLDTFLLSCRAMGRGVETAFLSSLRDIARQKGFEKIKAQFIPTSKNKPAQSFLPSHGFIHSGNTHWEAEWDRIPMAPRHIRMTFK